jgi:8-oxo-dGTP pyrophosphatase MutT (NUDIX family)
VPYTIDAPFLDTLDTPDETALAQVVDWTVEQWQSGRRVLVRCQAGWNRSGLVVGKALVATGIPGSHAVEMISQARGSMALCNRTFRALVLGLPPPTVPRWGTSGAAGILFRRRDGDEPRYLLLRRAPGTFDAGTWGLPGGAMHAQETAWHAAVRETEEEIGPILRGLPDPETPHRYVDEDGWTYSTFTVDHIPTVRLNEEHTRFAWVTAQDAEALTLQPDLARSWSVLTRQLKR